MQETKEQAAALVVAAVMLIGGCAAFKTTPRAVARTVIGRWSAPSAAQGRLLLDEYGVPDDVTPGRVVWNRRGPWKRVAAFDRKPVYRTPDDLAVVEETVSYRVTPEQTADLLAFSGSLTVDLERGELSSRSDRESMNFLNLNLADEVSRRIKTPEEALVARRGIAALAAAGKSSPYTERLLFVPEGSGGRSAPER